MLKDNLALCRRCFYVKRGSCRNMSVSELVHNLSECDAFRDKSLPQSLSQFQAGNLVDCRLWADFGFALYHDLNMS